ncbi:MAG TPA: hypothetical protein VFL16_04390 [Steroidobacteraceae bacterium]|nr:hypothetical protein [Steroidobacteraceae bacterium]
MATNNIRKLRGLATGIAVLGMLLAGCSKAPVPAPAEPASAPPASAPPASAPHAGEAPGGDAPADTPDPATGTPPSDSAEPAPSPGPTPPPPTEPSAAPKPTAAATEPALESMQRAAPSAKISVPVDLRYHFDSDPATHGATTLHLAAVPRVAGSGLRVSFKPAAGIVLQGGALEVQKASAAGVYRQQFSVARSANAASQLRVLVTMDMPQGQAFGYFTIPLESAPPASATKASGNPPQKPESVKQR